MDFNAILMSCPRGLGPRWEEGTGRWVSVLLGCVFFLKSALRGSDFMAHFQCLSKVDY